MRSQAAQPVRFWYRSRMDIRTPFARFFDSVKHGVLMVAAISVASNLLLLALPIYSLQIFDRVLLSRSVDTLWVLSLGVMIALGCSVLLEAFRGQLLLRLSNRMALAFEGRLLSEILMRSSRQGDRSLQSVRDLGTLRNFISTPQGLVALLDAPWVPFYLIVVYLLNPVLGHAMLAGAMALILIAWLTEKIATPLIKEAGEAAQRAQRRLEGLAQASDVIVAHGMQTIAQAHWSRAQHEAMAHTSRAGVAGATLASAAKSIRLLLNVTLTGLGAYLAARDELTIGAMIAANIVTSRALAPIELLIGASRQLIGVRIAWKRLADVLGNGAVSDTTRLPPPAGRVEVEQVIYMPPGAAQPTIKGLSFKLEPGTFLGLIGPSAAGKSTLARLLVGILPPRSGVIRLDGADVLAWDRGDFGKACGYLPQDVQLLDGTVHQNIARFTDAPDEAVVAAAQDAAAHEMILRLPQGYQTEVGPAGAALSAGQRQRIGLARALFGAPHLIVLDEPNSNLDTEGEQALTTSLGRVKARGATLIVVSHRPSVLGLADMLAVLVDGQLQQFGPKQEILKRTQPQAVTVERNVA